MAKKLYPPRQLAFRVESSEGTLVSSASFTSDDLVQVIDPQMTPTPTRFDRNLASRGFGTTPAHYADGTCELTFSVELTGHTDNSSTPTSAPKWSKLLEACGLEMREVARLAVNGAISGGPIQANETVVGGTSGEEGVAIGYSYTGDTSIDIEVNGGFSAAETATGSVSGANFTVGSSPLGSAAYGYSWTPKTSEASNKTLTANFRMDGDLYEVYGLRGTFQLRWVTHDRPMLDFTFSGIYSTSSASPNLSELAANSFEAMEPEPLVNVASTLTAVDGDALSGADLCWSEATFDMGNNVTVRQCANGTNGWLGGVIANRAPTFTINPDDPGVAAYPFIDKLQDGTRARFKMVVPGSTGNRFEFRIPHLQANSQGYGNRDERVSLDLSFDCTRGQDDGANGSSLGHDNEFVLINY